MVMAVNPEAIPGSGIDPDQIDVHASQIRRYADSVADSGSSLEFHWQRLAGVYEAPESEALLGLMTPVSAEATTVRDNLRVVSSALQVFADEVRPIKVALDSLRADAVAFRASIAHGVSVREPAPVYLTSGSQYSSGDVGAQEGPRFRTVTKQWHEVQEYVDRNNDLIARVDAQQVALWDAERTCASRIRTLFGGPPLRSPRSGDDRFGYGVSEIPRGASMPWGSAVERTENCGEAALTFVVKDFLWEGVVVGGVWGTVEGLLTLVAGFDPATGAFFSPDAYGAAWSSVALLGASVAIAATPPFNLIKVADEAAQLFGGGILPREIHEITDRVDEASLNAGKSLLAWDKWADDPGTALGESLFNVGTILIPAAAAVSGVKAASAAGTALSKAARVVDLLDPSTWAISGTVRLADIGFGGFARLVDDSVAGSALDGRPPISLTPTDAASALAMLRELGVDSLVPLIRMQDGVPLIEFPGGAIELAPEVKGDPGDATSRPRRQTDPPPLPYAEFAKINQEYRLATGEVSPARFDEWAHAMSDAYPVLTPEEVKGIYFYTTEEGHAAVVSRLRNKGDITSDDDLVAAQIEYALSGLAKLPSSPGVSSRGVGMSPDLVAQFVVGEEWSDAAFFSSSTDPAIADRFARMASARGQTPGLLSIDGVSGSDVSPFSAFPEESEVLFPGQTKFLVIGAHLDINGEWRIQLKEVRR